MAQFFEAIDQFFENGIGLADEPRLSAIRQELTQLNDTLLSEQKAMEEKEENDEEILDKLETVEEYAVKVKSLEDAILQLKEKKTSEQTSTLEQKQTIVNGIIDLIQKEKNIKAAFDQFHTFQEEWNNLPNMDLNQSKKLDKQYGKLVEDFYYHINIYKAIQDHDFKRNQQLKTNLITRLKGMLDIKETKGMLPQLQQIQKEWQSLGPVGKEMREQIWEEYIKFSDEVFNLYLALKEKEKAAQKENLKQKEALIEQLKAISSKERKSPKDWKNDADAIIELQNQWKAIGLVPLGVSKKVNKVFRSTANEFFAARNEFFNEQKDAYKENKKVRSELIAKANEIAEGEVSPEQTKLIIQLQNDWKASGSVHPRDEQKLWNKFREACNNYFNKKNEAVNAHKSVVRKSLDEKKSVIELAEKAANDQDIVAATEAFVASWPLTKSDTSKIDGKIQEVLKEKILESKDAESSINQWLETQKTSLEKIEVEDFSDVQKMIRNAINGLNEDVRKFETNLSFFNTSSNNPLLDQANTSLENTKKIIEAHKAVLKHIRAVKK